MTILSGKQAKSLDQAALLAFDEAGIDGMAPEVASLFATVVDARAHKPASRDAVSRAVVNRYGKQAGWHGSWWHVPVPKLRFEARGVPCLQAECQVYMVAAVDVKRTWGSQPSSATVVEPVGKAFTLTLPLLFIGALLAEDLERFSVVMKDTTSTSWEVPGYKHPVTLPNDFVGRLRQQLRQMPVADWLESFGPQGHTLAPMVVGALLGQLFAGKGESTPGQEPYTWEALNQAVEGLGYTAEERQRMLARAVPHLRSEMSLEEAIRVVLRYGI